MFLWTGISLYLYKQADWADVLKAWCRDVPAARVSRLPAHLQRHIVPAIWEQRREPLPGMDAPTFQEQLGYRIMQLL